ncbi:hypothetical protein BDW22DRAFT_862684 [Trametopsis cervina]|nr:hypothetical protein BDW22DRAFT_862684 [Trametopsis cervina]
MRFLDVRRGVHGPHPPVLPDDRRGVSVWAEQLSVIDVQNAITSAVLHVHSTSMSRPGPDESQEGDLEINGSAPMSDFARAQRCLSWPVLLRHFQLLHLLTPQLSMHTTLEHMTSQLCDRSLHYFERTPWRYAGMPFLSAKPCHEWRKCDPDFKLEHTKASAVGSLLVLGNLIIATSRATSGNTCADSGAFSHP